VGPLSPEAAATVRDAREGDAEALLAIYAPSVLDSAASFELELPSVEELAERVRRYGASHAWLLAERVRDGRVLGYAYGSPHRARAAYRFSCEVSAYVAREAQRQGVGSRLYAALFDRLAERGYCHAYAGIVLPNVASEALHRRVGFEPIGVFPAVGWKLGRWHDVAWYHRTLRETPPTGDGSSRSDL
jgi:L-amino acid N-acyltransferase YncA